MSARREEAIRRVEHMNEGLEWKNMYDFTWPIDGVRYIEGGKESLYEVMSRDIFVPLRSKVREARANRDLVFFDENDELSNLDTLYDASMGTGNRFFGLRQAFSATIKVLARDAVNDMDTQSRSVLEDSYEHFAKLGFRQDNASLRTAINGGIDDATTDFAGFFAAVPHILARDKVDEEPFVVAMNSFSTVTVPRIMLDIRTEQKLSVLLGERPTVDVLDGAYEPPLQHGRLIDVNLFRSQQTEQGIAIAPVVDYEKMRLPPSGISRFIGLSGKTIGPNKHEPAIGCPAGIPLIRDIHDWMLETADAEDIWEDSASFTS